MSAEQFTERFDREARVVASLNHPNICTIHDVGPNYLVIELIGGETLGGRIAQGPIPLGDALRIAGQIADALHEAHEKGVTHRDLKPDNVKIRPDGTVKVLDFGLAKVGGMAGVTSDTGASAFPCRTDSHTRRNPFSDGGVARGTAAAGDNRHPR